MKGSKVMSEKYCHSCGAKITDECTFCTECGANQKNIGASSAATVTKQGGGSKTPLIIIGIIIAVALIALCIILVINGNSGNSDTNSNSYITVDSNGNISANTTQNNNISNNNNNNADIIEPIPDTPEVATTITPYVKLNGENLYQCSAAYTYSDVYGNVMAISGLLEEELGVIATVAIGSSSIKSGYTLDKNGCNSSTYFDLVLIEGSDAEEYTTANNPSMFDDCEFKLVSFKEGSEATFTMLIQFSYNGEDYQLEAGGTASYQEAPANSNIAGGGNSGSSGSSGSRMCMLCYGKGICSVCDGSGLNSYYDFFTKEKRACDSCGGTLICKGCNGVGYY